MISKDEAMSMDNNSFEGNCICWGSSVKGCTARNCTWVPSYPTYPDPYPYVPSVPNTPWYPSTTTTTKLVFGDKVKIPELYPENLDTLKAVMENLERLSSIEGVFGIEIRVKVDDVDAWAVIGWGESGDPCLLRFE